MRQFLALELPGRWRELLQARCRLHARASGWRWIPPESAHLTLRFLGRVAAERDELARRVWRETVAAHGELELSLGATGCFPPRGRPRVLWVATRPSPALRALQAALERAARGLGFEAEEREFRAHVTLARARRGARVALPEGWTGELEPTRFTAREVILFRSVLRPSGARYTALERYPLNAAA